MPIPDEIKKYMMQDFTPDNQLRAARNMNNQEARNSVDYSKYKKTIRFFKDNPRFINDVVDPDTGFRALHYAALSKISDEFLPRILKFKGIDVNVKDTQNNCTILYVICSEPIGIREVLEPIAILLIEAGAKIDNINHPTGEDSEVGKNGETELFLMRRRNNQLNENLLALLTEKNFSTPEAYQEFRRSMDVPSQNTTMSEGASARDPGTDRGTNNR